MGSSSEVTVAPVITAPRKGRTGAVVIGLCLLGSTIIAVVVWERFKRSEMLLLDNLQGMRDTGRELSVPGCVDATLDWWKNCQAMSELCDRSVGRIMEQCLDGRDRTDFCSRADLSSNANSGFGFADCVQRAQGNRKIKKHCGTAYRAVAYYCEQINASIAKAGP